MHNLDQLHYIVEVAKTRSIHTAAQNLFVSATTISQSISNFEKKFGVQLFKRSRMGTVPTDLGENIIHKAKEIISKVHELDDEIKTQTLSANKQLKIVSSQNQNLLLSILPNSISTLRMKYPEIRIELKEKWDVVENIKQDGSDIGFIAHHSKAWESWKDQYKNSLHFEQLYQGKLYGCLSSSSPLAQKKGLLFKELVDQTVVCYTPSTADTQELFNYYGPIKVVLETNSLEIFKKVIYENAVAVLSDLTIRNNPIFHTGEIITLPIEDYFGGDIIFGYVRSKAKHFSDPARYLIESIKYRWPTVS